MRTVAKLAHIRKPAGMEKRRPTISLIWAMDRNRLIGNNNALPWKLPADMQWFRKQTMGKPVLMGRKTFESIGKPLPGRLNLVLTRQKGLEVDGCRVVHSLDEAINAATDVEAGVEEIMVMGGSEIYSLLLDDADRLYCTVIDAEFEGDAWFPDFDIMKWQQTHTESHQPDESNGYSYSFNIYDRTSG